MSFKAKQSTARTYIVGPVLDADGVAVTGGVVADFKMSKNGGAPAALDGSATLTHRHTGFYSLALTANDHDTVGTAQVTIDDTVNACPMLNIQVVEEVIFDALFAATANAYAGAAGSTTLGSGAITATVIATGAIDADSLAADTITDAKVANDVTIASVTGAVGSVTGAVGSVTGNVGGNVTGSVGSVAAGGITAASFGAGAITAAVIATDAIDADAIAANAIDAAAIASGAITNAKFASGAITADTIADGSIDAATFAAGAITAAAIATGAIDADAIADDAIDAGAIASGAITAAKIADGAIDAATFASGALDAVWSTAARTLTAGTNIVLAKGVGVTGFNDLDAAGVRSAVGLASANLDTQLADIPTVAEFEARTLLAAAYGTAANQTTIISNIAALNNITAASVWAVASRTLTAGTNIQLPSNGLDLILLESGITAGVGLTDDANTQLTSINLRQGMALALSALAGTVSGGGTSAITFKQTAKPAGETRILTATSDDDGNRPTLTLKVPT